MSTLTDCASCGRESGDWVFSYDQRVSSRSEVALAGRGERAVQRGQRVLLGDRRAEAEGAARRALDEAEAMRGKVTAPEARVYLAIMRAQA